MTEERTVRIAELAKAFRDGLMQVHLPYLEAQEAAEQNSLPDGADVETSEGSGKVIPLHSGIKATDMFPRPPA